MKLTHPVTKEIVTVKNAKELRNFLSYQNPYWMRKFKAQIEKERPDVEITGHGPDVRIVIKS